MGAGGMGRVVAVHDAVLDRDVARKTPAPGASAGAIARLRREARITARLDHPGIVPVHDGGTDADGRPWYTMRLVRGRSLAEIAKEGPTLLPRVLAACQAVAYAHSRGVVHRDLTPWNVLVGPFGETVVVDWGIARVLDEPDEGEPVSSSPPEPGLTVVGAVIGTHGWMSPEQALGEPADRRSDVYALGRLIQLVSPEPAADLAAIVARATAPDPAARYPDAGELAADLEAWLAGRRVSAYDYNAAERMLRLVRAWRVPLAVAGVAAVALAATATAGWLRTRAERDRAVAAEADLASLLGHTRAELAAAALREGDTAAAAVEVAGSLAVANDPLARGVAAALLAGPVVRHVGHVPLSGCEHVALGDGVACSGATVSVLHDDGTERWTYPSPGRAGWSRPDGPLLVLHQGWLRAVRDGVEVAQVKGLPRAGLRLAPDGVDVAIADQLEVWLGVLPDAPVRVRCPGGERALTVLSRGDRFAIPCDGGTLLLGRGTAVEADVQTGVLRASAGAWLADDRLLVGTLDGALVEVSIDGAATPVTTVPGPIRTVAVAPDGRRVAVGSEAHAVRIVDLAVGGPVASVDVVASALDWQGDRLRVATPAALETFEIGAGASVVPAEHGLSAVAWAPDGRLALADGSGVLSVVGPDGARQARWQWQQGVLKDVVFAHDGALWSGGDPGTLRRVADAVTDPGMPHHVRALAPVDGGVLVGTWSQQAWRVDHPGGAAPWLDSTVSGLDAAGGRVLVVAESPWVRLWEHGALRTVADGDERGLAAISADTVALADGPVVRVLDAATLAERFTVTLPQGPTALALAGELLWTGFLDGTVRAHAIDGERLSIRAHRGRVSDLSLSPDGATIASASWDATVRRWRVEAATLPTDALRARLSGADEPDR